MKKSWSGLVFGAVVVLASGCASSRPCQIIPMQLELAREERDRLQTLAEAKETDVKRAQENLDLSRKRLAQMEEERDELRAYVEAHTEKGGAQ